jgi:hypothetical protein
VLELAEPLQRKQAESMMSMLEEVGKAACKRSYESILGF